VLFRSAVVNWGSNSVSILLNLHPHAAQAGTIAGAVAKLDGTTPIGGAVIKALSNSIPFAIDTTDIGGNYSIGLLHPGLYSVEASKPNYYSIETIDSIEVDSAQTTIVNISLGQQPCDYYLPGDINGDSSRIGGDVTYGVRYFKSIGTTPRDSCFMDSTETWLYVAGDVNGNCEFRGSDITRLVAFFKGTAPIGYCHLCPPPPLKEHLGRIKSED
jgi:hypothetical protein